MAAELPSHLRDQNDATIREGNLPASELHAIELSMLGMAMQIRAQHRPDERVTVASVVAMLEGTAGEYHRLEHVAKEAGR